MGFLLGLGAIVLIVVGLIAIMAVVSADESVRTYPARLGEQDRSLNYPTTDATETVVLEYVVDPEGDPLVITDSCAETNDYLLYMMKHIAKRIAENPDLGYLYETTLITIRGAWCYD